jgi:acetylornithine deacetylase/succinyl-diaminopimelate desuccinylase-like protein
MVAPIMNDALTAQTIELLQQMIRNECVNDGTVESGQEVRTTDLLRTYLEGSGLDLEVYEPDGAPGRASLVARIEGSDPTAPTLCLMGHTDVVPVTPATWTRDPFGGELIKGEVWGRGAVDMLNLTASQAVALKALARQGWRPRGTLVYLACADEEAGGMLGAGHVCKRHWDSLRADYLLTENGGLVSSHGGELNVTVHVGEKGVAWRRLRVTGTPGHGSMPYGADNALVKAAHVVSRLADYRPAPYVDDLWQTFVGSLGVDPALKDALRDPSRVDEAIAKLPAGVAKFAWSTTHTTFSPNMCRAGVKTNVIPDVVDIEVDIRTIPGDNEDEVRPPHRQGPRRPVGRGAGGEALLQAGLRVAHGDSALGCAGARGGRPLSRREAHAAHDRGVHRRALLSASAAPSPTASASSRAPSPPRPWSAASTATTSASTWSRSPSPPRPGSTPASCFLG